MSSPSTSSFWHYSRSSLADRITLSFEVNLVQCLILFAPRRIGKTEFLEFDLKPRLEDKGFSSLYFSFFNERSDIITIFVDYLKSHLNHSFFQSLKLKEISFSWCKIEIEKWKVQEWDIIQVLSALAYQYQNGAPNKKLILMLDEIQELQYHKDGAAFLAGLRTALDKNKESIGVIFTGSSQDGLRRMFNDRLAPFFHFGQNIEMPKFDREFTDFLADKYKSIINKEISKDELYQIFCKLDRVTEYIRQIINTLVLEPDFNLRDVYLKYIDTVMDSTSLNRVWESFSPIQKAVFKWLAKGESTIFSPAFKEFAKNSFGIEPSNNQIQYAVKLLLKGNHLIVDEIGNRRIDNVLLVNWLKNNKEVN